MQQTRPDLGAVASYTFPKPQRVRVGNGTVVAVDLPGQQLISLRLILPGGGAVEPLDALGVSALTSEVLEDGPDGNSSLAPALERYGAEWISRVTWDGFITGLDAPTSRLDEAVLLFNDAVRRPALNPDDIIRRREQLLERFWLEAASASTLAMRSLGGQLFTGRYATPLAGGPIKLADITPERVAAFHADSLASVAGTLVVVGDLAGVDLEELGRGVFGDAAAVPERRSTEPGPPPGELPRVLIVDRPGSVQSALVIAHRAPSRSQVDLPRAEGISEVLGGMFTSRLNMELRERLGYTYGAGSRFDLRRDSGVFFTSTQVEASTTAHSVTSSFEQIAKLREDGVTEDELATVRESNTVGLPVSYSTARSVAGALVDIVMHDLPDDNVDRVRAGYEKLTAEDLNSAAVEYLRPEEAVVVVVGDADSLREPLTQAGVGPVEVRSPESLWS
ncbi:pitrilysin family protein [Nocardiopsis sp. MG754419]|uniref:M16 family metallopeptidase n=1 Tax=Nocardiopsis sp. MG754419 TaxID=2259865 RepID=UPI001BAB1AB3|nr:pitrilysin family protein [Nocardiopsis sp. MG754419]MBR8744810.1 insulinase family protein [Nocardiopsis sp. MG754419]